MFFLIFFDMLQQNRKGIIWQIYLMLLNIF
nr:MAG TPA: hypothetical protein [Caudoviricetes sp.]